MKDAFGETAKRIECLPFAPDVYPRLWCCQNYQAR